jgi:alkylhydroperoxidase family enzyme
MTFLADAPMDEQVERMFTNDVDLQGYVANQTRLWAHSPESLTLLSYVLKRATDTAGLTVRQRALLVTTCASTLGDAYCSLAFGTKLAGVAGADVAVRAVTGDDTSLSPTDRALVSWTRQLVEDPNATTAEQVDALRAVGYDDQQIFAITLFVSLRLAYATVNDALGAVLDSELAALAPVGLRAAVSFGRQPVAADSTPSAVMSRAEH